MQSTAPCPMSPPRSTSPSIKSEAESHYSQIQVKAMIQNIKLQLQEDQAKLQKAIQHQKRKDTALDSLRYKRKSHQDALVKAQALVTDRKAEWQKALDARKAADKDLERLKQEATQMRLNFEDALRDCEKADHDVDALHFTINRVNNKLTEMNKELAIVETIEDLGLQNLARSLHGLKSSASRIKSDCTNEEGNEVRNDKVKDDVEKPNDEEQSDSEWMDIDDEEATFSLVSALKSKVQQTQGLIKEEIDSKDDLKKEDDEEKRPLNLHNNNITKFSTAGILDACAQMEQAKKYIDDCMAELRNATTKSTAANENPKVKNIESSTTERKRKVETSDDEASAPSMKRTSARRRWAKVLEEAEEETSEDEN